MRSELSKPKAIFTLSVVISALCFSLPAHSTVLEYDKDGEITVTETDTQKTAKPVSASIKTTSSDLKSLTRDVALRYSGSIGVRKAGLDALTFVELFEALIQRESSFNPTIVSPKGAQGLGQLMPDTASDMGVVNPFDPESNLIGSAKYLTIQLAEFGSLELALAAYNAGPERVRQYKGVPPFKETQDYIAWISAKAGIPKAKSQPVKASLPVQKINKEEPLKGDQSVWEF